VATAERPVDIALFGATGFTGGLTADYLAEHAPEGTRWAVVGRNRAKLEALRNRLGADVEIREADVDDPKSLRLVAEEARVVITTVGPYLTYGEPLVAACAEAGTDYVDLTGESEFVDRTYLRHHAKAEDSGARLVHSCGLDSIPYDLGVLFTVQHLPRDVPLRVRGAITGGLSVSGGTFGTMVSTILPRMRQARAVHAERRRVEPTDPSRRVHAGPGTPGRDPDTGMWLLPFASLDPQVVERSARALDVYGPDFDYRHYLAVPSAVKVAGLVAGVSGLFALAQLPPTRRAVLRLRPAGTGPSPERRARSWFRVRFVGEGVGQRVVTEVSGGDPGYGETAKMLAESALSLRYDDLPETAGQVTTAVAMGDALRARLERAGLRFEVVEGGR
jgi:short subunit dehydrogenase-like uncharacterized protein